MLRKLYFAYGSNLNVKHMAQRCPRAKPLGAAYFPGWRLVFRGVADIEPGNDDELLPVGIWSITEECEKKLDFYEGFPRLYRKEEVNGIMTYRMNSTYIAGPSSGYYHTIRQGYEDFGLDQQILCDAADWAEIRGRDFA